MAAPSAPSAAGGKGSGPQQHFASLYVGDLNQDVTEAVLFEVFNPVGPVASIRICRDSMTRKSLGYAYVNFHNVSDAERALDTLNYQSIKGRSCRIMWSHRDPAMRKAGSGNIFVKNLDKSIDNKALYDTFSLFGNILSCKVASDLAGNSKGYGFVHYESPEAAQTAIEKVNNMEIGSKTVQVCLFQKQDEREGGTIRFTNVYVKNVPADWDEAKLLELFKPYGNITSSVMMKDAKGRPYAFINYEDADHAAKAVEELNGKDLRAPGAEGEPEDGDKLFAGRAMTKAEREEELRKERQAQAGVNLYIKNLDEAIDDAKLTELFAPYGEVKSARVIMDEAGKSRGFGFVAYATPQEATKAVTEMHLKSISGKPLYVGLAERREERKERLESRFRGPKGMGGMGGFGKGKGMGKGMGMMGMGGKGMMGMMGGGPMGMRPNMQNMGPMYSMQQMQQMQMQQMQMGKGMMGMGGKGMMGMGGMQPKGMPKGGMQQMRPAQPMPQMGNPMASAAPGMQKQMIGEKLYQIIARTKPALAGKITGMMLEMDNGELAALLDNPAQLEAKVAEACRVLGQQ